MTEHDEPTLPDLLREGLDVVFVGINPSLYSVARGHYFARKTNRFWPCLSRSVLSLGARRALGVEALAPMHDRQLPGYGFGFTDVVKRPTAKANELGRAEFAEGAKTLRAKLEYYQPRIACFHGMRGVMLSFGWRKSAPDPGTAVWSEKNSPGFSHFNSNKCELCPPPPLRARVRPWCQVRLASRPVTQSVDAWHSG